MCICKKRKTARYFYKSPKFQMLSKLYYESISEQPRSSIIFHNFSAINSFSLAESILKKLTLSMLQVDLCTSHSSTHLLRYSTSRDSHPGYWLIRAPLTSTLSLDRVDTLFSTAAPRFFRPRIFPPYRRPSRYLRRRSSLLSSPYLT